MAMDKSRYPENWKEISHHIRFVRAGGKCEECGVEHGAIGCRDKDANWYDIETIDAMPPEQQLEMFGNRVFKPTKIILTVHHIGIPKEDGSEGSPHDKMDCRPSNLLSLCQRCHLKADMPIHIANRKKTLAKKKAAAIAATGQQSLFDAKLNIIEEMVIPPARLTTGETYKFGMVTYMPIYWDGILIAEWRHDLISWYASDNGLSFKNGYGYLYKLLQKFRPSASTIYYPTYDINDLELMLHFYDVKLEAKL